jgi:acetyl esterase
VRLLDRVQAASARRLLSLPEPVIRALAGAPKRYRGVTLDPRIQLALFLAGKLRPTLHSLEPSAARREYRVACAILDIEKTAIFDVADRTIGGVPARIYRSGEGLLPVVLFLHGGGHVIGDLETYDSLCRWLAADARCAVVSVDYRLAPEHRFPAAVEDACAVFDALARGEPNLDPTRIAVAGDSAGGNLAAVVAIHARDRGGVQPVLQVLIYPATDVDTSRPSRIDLAEGYGLTAAMIAYFEGHYRSPERDPRRSVILAEARGLCPAFVVTCGFDPLRDEGEAYASKLAAAGVAVVNRSYDSLCHGSFTMAGVVPEARAMLGEIGAAIGRAFSRTERSAA